MERNHCKLASRAILPILAVIALTAPQANGAKKIKTDHPLVTPYEG